MNLLTYLTEDQMQRILTDVRKCIQNNEDERTFEYDSYLKSNEDVRVCVNFTRYLDTLSIAPEKNSIQKLDAAILVDGVEYFYDTVVFQQRVQFMLDQYNELNSESVRQQKQIREERLNQLNHAS